MTKTDLRRHYRALRKAHAARLGPAAHREAGETIRRQIEQSIGLKPIISGYAAMASELDVMPALDTWRENGHRIALPWFADSKAPMIFREFSRPLVSGTFGIDQPEGSEEELLPDMLLVPLVAADPKGNRIGQGGGHFDRALAALRQQGDPIAIGIAWPCQIAERLPADPWDERLDYIATPERLIRIKA